MYSCYWTEEGVHVYEKAKGSDKTVVFVPWPEVDRLAIMLIQEKAFYQASVLERPKVGGNTNDKH